MGWLVSQVVTSLLGAIIIIKIYDTIVGGILGPVVKTGLFVSVWTAITAGLGMRSFKKTVHGLRQSVNPKNKRLK